MRDFPQLPIGGPCTSNRPPRRARCTSFQSKELPVDLRHEATHALLHAVLADVPLWLDEGLAEYYETPAEQRGANRQHGSLRLKPGMLSGKLTGLDELESRRKLVDMSAEDYHKRVGPGCNFMLHGPPEAREELTRYLAESAQGACPSDWHRVVAARLPDLDAQLARHFRSLSSQPANSKQANWKTASKSTDWR